MYVGFIGDHFFLLSTDSMYSLVPGDRGGPIFYRQEFFGARFTYKLVYYNLYHVEPNGVVVHDI
jgi:hypothetical protein